MTAFAGHLSAEAHEDFPYDRLDSKADLLRDAFPALRLTAQQADDLLAWFAANCERTASDKQSTEDSHAMSLAHAIAEILATHDLKLTATAIAFASGIDQACVLGSQSEAADALRLGRATVSKHVSRWRDILGGTTTGFTRGAGYRGVASAVQRRMGRAKVKGRWAHRYCDPLAAQGREGLYSPHAVAILYAQTVKQVAARRPVHEWDDRTRQAWVKELTPIHAMVERLMNRKENDLESNRLVCNAIKS